jgi:glyoxylase I family protein
VGFDIDGVLHITLRVSDLERSRSFFAGVLGLVVDQDFPGERLRFRLGAYTRLVLEPTLPGASDADRAGVRRAGLDHVTLGVRSRAELDRVVTVLRDAGVRAESGRGDASEPAVVTFRDPDGFVWRLAERPH